MTANDITLRSMSDNKYRLFCDFLSHHCGIVLGDNKQYLVRSRLSTLVAKFRFDSLDELLDRTVNSQDRILQSAVIDAMTNNETLWFRDTYPFDILAKLIFPEYASKQKSIRIWSAASSSGQEPYSIAMTILEQAARSSAINPSKMDILATDISDSMALSRGLSPQRKKIFFENIDTQPGNLRIVERVRNMVTFRQQNLLANFSVLGKFDIIFCRNVLIYFAPDVKERIINSFARSLNIGGYLFLGSSEYVSHLNENFEMVRCNPGIVFRKIK